MMLPWTSPASTSRMAMEGADILGRVVLPGQMRRLLPFSMRGRCICPKTRTCTSISRAIISAPTRSEPCEAIWTKPIRIPSTSITALSGRSLLSSMESELPWTASIEPKSQRAE